jgi:spermidine/putrescine transport system ATP-binding protein
MPEARPIVEIQSVDKYYGENHVVKKMNMDIFEGEFLTMLGPSGCGKTTTLRMIAGFEEPTAGSILVEGESVQNKEPYERNVNTVFQSYALFPHMSVFNNVAFGLKMKGVAKSEIRERVREMLELVQLKGFDRRMPSQLSGGQRQRVAIARALINRPRVLLLDEPLGALDMKLRKQMQVELKRLQKRLGITFIYVTHDQEEALTMSDRIAVMNDGVLEQLGAPDEIYERPKSRFVADFIGETNLFDATVAKSGGPEIRLNMEFGEAPALGGDFSEGEIVYVSVRPEKVQFSDAPVEGFGLFGAVKEYIYVGGVMKALMELPNGQEFRVNRMAGQYLPPVGATVFIHWHISDAVVMHSRQGEIYGEIENASLGESA